MEGFGTTIGWDTRRNIQGRPRSLGSPFDAVLVCYSGRLVDGMLTSV
jgi:hypothetical protein